MTAAHACAVAPFFQDVSKNLLARKKYIFN